MMIRQAVLLLEDEPFIALDLEGLLFETGMEDVVTLASCADALEWLEGNTPKLAIVDPRLNDGICSAVVRKLVGRSVPFLLYSGESGSLVDEEPAFGRGEHLPKPSQPGAIIAGIHRALNPERPLPA